jgi:predicted ArsR family transcriptional regulator
MASRTTRYSNTREEIAALLLRGGRTVADLAEELGLSRNAVRAQLTALERDGLVVVARRDRGGVGKPAFIYELTPEGARLFPGAYARLFSVFLEAAGRRLGDAGAEELLRDAGRLAAEAHRLPADLDLAERISLAAGIVEELGGMVELREDEQGIVIEGYSCPLGEVVSERPEACLLLETMLTELLGVPVSERCEPGPRPRCRFVLAGQSTSAD